MTRSVRPLLALKRRINSPNQLKLSNIQIGQRGELQAITWLIRRGFVIIDRNLFTQNTEIDVLAYHPRTHLLLLAEVKTRLHSAITAYAAVSNRKKIKMWRLAEWLTTNWHQYVEWRYREPPNNPFKSPGFASIRNLSTVFPKSARFAIISVVGKQVECLIAAPW